MLHTPSRLNTIDEQPRIGSPKSIPAKEVTSISLSEMHVTPKKPEESRVPLREANDQVLTVEPSSHSSGPACLAKYIISFIFLSNL